jgi:hypothetical protein
VIQYRVMIYEAPGRQLRRVRSFKALNHDLARGAAVAAAEQYAHQSRVARYSITWGLWEMTWPTAEWVKVAAGALVPALERREATD